MKKYLFLILLCVGFIKVFSQTNNLKTTLDTDGDGYPDLIDLDDDNDGILDLTECNVACSDIFVNGGYENPNISLPPYNSSTMSFLPQAESGGWQTTAIDGLIEIWRSGYHGVPAAEGNQFVELNANYASTLYQTFCLNGSAGLVTWSLKHRGRYGIDVATVKMGNSLANASVVATMTDGTSGWGSYSGTYIIPAGQNTLIIAFESVSASGGPTQGNFLDNIVINISQGCADSDGDGIPNSLDSDSDGDGCSDAAEGDENVLYTQISNGKITGAVDSNGIPILVNSGGAADIGGDVGQGAGETAEPTNIDCKCNLASANDGTSVSTKHGITALGRAGSENDNWPMVRKGGWTALESKTKGFVINRLTSGEIANLSSSQLKQGMMVYNTTLDCLYINTDGSSTGWKCFNNQGCPFNF